MEVGVYYDLKIGTELNLKTEPDNQVDSYAVAIYYKDTKSGYLPRSQNKAISKFLNCGYTDLFEVKICQITMELHTERRIGVQMKRKRKTSKSRCRMPGKV
jgi:hypothetical protein